MRAWGLLPFAAAQWLGGDADSWCEGTQVLFEACNTHLCSVVHQEEPVDAEFGPWNEWGECNCQFLKERSRPIAQHHQHGGAPLGGVIVEAAQCTPDLAACNIETP